MSNVDPNNFPLMAEVNGEIYKVRSIVLHDGKIKKVVTQPRKQWGEFYDIEGEEVGMVRIFFGEKDE